MNLAANHGISVELPRMKHINAARYQITYNEINLYLDDKQIDKINVDENFWILIKVN